MENSIFAQISIVIGVATLIALIMKQLKQPLILSYIVTGIIVGPSVLDLVQEKEALSSLSEIGITLLLFIIGLGLNANVIKSLGRVSTLVAGAILLSVGTIGYFASLALGFDVITSIILGVALFFSSTIIILKVLSDNREVNRLFGQIAIGVILIDDVVATIALVAISALASSGGNIVDSFAGLALKALLLGVGLYIVGAKIMPRVSRLFATNQELLFLFSAAWGLLIATVFHEAGFSYEVGALFAGVSLAGLPYATEMGAKLKPLRDFFIVLFFVSLGENFTFDTFQQSLWPALILSAIVMIGKPVMTMVSLGLMRYTRSTSFRAAMHLSQISEFSIIVVIFGASAGVIMPESVPVITLVALITIGLSTYLMNYDDYLLKLTDPYLKIFERKTIAEARQKRTLYPVILFGFSKGGHEFIKVFRQMRQRYLVVDYDPDNIDLMASRGIRHAYGDATDEEFLEEINAGKARLVVSMMTDFNANRQLLRYVNRYRPRTTFICHAGNFDEAAELYRHGASYVMLPHFIGSQQISAYIKKNGFDPDAFDEYRKKHVVIMAKKALSNS